MKRFTFFTGCILSSVLLLGCSGVSQEDYSQLQSNYESIASDFERLQSDYDAVVSERDSLTSQNESVSASLESIESEYAAYKESMKEYEGLSQAEAEARQIEAEAVAESKAAAEAAAESEAQAQAEAEEKMGYDTGITYDQLARTPDEYIGKKIKFTGTVLQVLEGDEEVQIRLAVNDDYDTILYCGYSPDIVSSRVLENDTITIYGLSSGLVSYESTMGGTITIPGAWVEKIDQ